VSAGGVIKSTLTQSSVAARVHSTGSRAPLSGRLMLVALCVAAVPWFWQRSEDVLTQIQLPEPLQRASKPAS
jgi:hypothetical protein